MWPPQSVKNVQKLTGCTTSLNRFISRLGEKGLPFFKLLKNIMGKVVFKRLNTYLTSPPIHTH